MGTRGLTCVVKGGEYKVAQYGQWDHYPSGQGVEILHFLHHGTTDRKKGETRKLNLTKFKKQVDKCFWGTAKQVSDAWNEGCGKKVDGWLSMEDANKFKESKWAYLSRDTGSGILDVVMAAEDKLMLVDSHEFAADSLFCEYAYVIDLDHDVFEVHVGFQKKAPPKSHRFASMPRDKKPDGTESDYFPCRLLKSYPLDALPDEKTFLKDCEPDEE